MRPFLSAYVFATLITGCTDATFDLDEGADINSGDEEKADGATGIEVMARLRPGTVDLKLTPGTPRQGYIFFAAEGTKVSLENTQGGTSAGADTVLKVYGPRLSDGSYPKTLATDEDSGFGKLGRIRDLEISIPGFYLVEIAYGAKVTTPGDVKARLKLSCTGTCDSDLPVAPLGLDIKWFQRAAERKALSLQAYNLASARLEQKAAGQAGDWAVVMDIDETTLDNSAYQKRRADLGLGFSLSSWTAWVNEKAEIPVPGAVAFIQKVKSLGGKLIFVTNRLAATECAPTEQSLQAQGIPYDGILCKTTASEKNTRFNSIATGTSGITGLPAMPTLMYVGDNIQDFPQLTQDVRKQPEAALAKFGDEFWLLPNPMYGSWEKNAD